MPHITLEYSANLDSAIPFPNLFARVHGILVDVGGLNIDNCKSRAVRLEDYFIGTGGERSAFVHADVRFLEGRPLEVRQEIGRRILSALDEAFVPSNPGDIQITVEMGDIPRAAYFKIPEGTLGP